MNKKASLLVFMSTLAATAACFSIVTATVSWFRTFENKDIDGSGSTFNSYFAGGDGTEQDPYQIANSTQMYNFAWLQYMGVFNKDADNNGVIDQQYYFVVNNDIDMSGMVIPPIGTVKNPFLGHFNGNDYVISNLTVSNEIDETQVTTDKIYYHPDGITNLEGETELGLYGPVRVVGFFGVVGTAKDLGTNLAYTYDTEVAKASNFYLDKTTVYSKSPSTLAGIVAGFVGAPYNPNADPDEQIAIIHDIGVYQSNLNFKQNAVGLSSYGTTVSKFSIVGDYSGNAIEWKSGESGQLDEFGGSIDFTTFTRRINYMATSGTWNAPGRYGLQTINNNTHSTLYFSNNTFNTSGSVGFYWKMNDPGTSSTVFLENGTYLPINVDTSSAGLDIDNEFTKSWTTTYSTYSSTSTNYTNSYYDGGNGEIVKNTNTGYIVGGDSGTYGKLRNRIFVAGSSYKSLASNMTNSSTLTAGTDIASMLKMVTFDKNGTGYIIKDDQNLNSAIHADLTAHFSNSARYDSEILNLQRYENVKTNFSNQFRETGTVEGLGPRCYIPSSLTSSYILNASNVVINDSSGVLNYSNYQFVKGGINFSLSKQGYVTAVISTATSNSSQFGFDLYRLERDASGTISTGSFSYVKEVYYNADEGKSSFTQVNSNYQKCFDYNWYKSLPGRTIYYLEVPLPPGDYVIGGAYDTSIHSTSLQGAYFLYLDIGSNGGGGTPTSSFEYKIENVKFAATKGNLEEYKNVLFLLSFAGATHGEGSIYFKHNGLTPEEEITISYTVMTVTPNTTITVTENTSAQTWNNAL